MDIMGFFRKTKGSISIFLCLIMLPMVTYATMIIDASRLQAAKSAISGAGDLTMNAALSEYDQVLKDMYGLFAMIQDEDNLEPALQSYFEQTIEGGLSGTNTDQHTVQEYAKVMTNWVLQMEESGELDFDNLLAMDVATFSTNNVSSSALANPAVMKRQIVDYMKYKGPVSLASTLFSKLSFLKNSSAQTEVLEQKVEYATSLNSVQSACNDAWTKIEEYNKLAEEFNNDRKDNAMEKDINRAYIACVRAILSSYYKEFSPFYRNIVYSMSNGGTATVDNTHYVDIDGLISSDDELNAFSTAEMYQRLSALNDAVFLLIDYEDGKDSYFEKVGGPVVMTYNESNPAASTVTFSSISDRNLDYPELQTYYENLQAFKNEVNKSYESIDEETLTNMMGEFFEYQNIYHTYDADFYDYIKILDEFLSVYNEFERVFRKYESTLKQELIDAGVSSADVDNELNNNTEYVEIKLALAKAKQIHRLFRDVSNQESVYNVAMKYEDLVNDFLAYEKAGEYYLKRAKSYVKPYYDKVVSINSKVSEIQSALSAVVTAMETAEREKGEWESSINNVDDGATKTSMMSDYQTSTDGISIADVELLKGVVDGYATYYNDFKTALESISFSGVSIVTGNLNYSDITTIAVAYLQNNNAAINNASSIAEEKTQIITAAAQYAGMIFFYGNSAIFATDGVNIYVYNGGYNVAFSQFQQECGYLDGFEDNTSTPFDKEKFILTLKSICEPIKTELTEEEKAEQNNQVTNINNTVSSGESTQIDNTASNTSTPSSNEGQETVDIKIGDILSEISTYCDQENVPVQNTPDSLDNSGAKSINVSSTDEEGYQSQGETSSAALGSAKNLLSEITKIGENVTAYAYMEEYFTEMFSCDTDRLDVSGDPMVTLSGTSLNPNTPWYGKEVEYMLWGNPDLNANVTANYAMIYMIRFALNAIYAFTAADIQSFALEIATAVAGWTVIGVPIVQAVVTIALALAESGVDIAKLRNGEDVPIYKNNLTFVCSPTGLANGIAETVVKQATNEISKAVENEIDKAAAELTGTIGDNIDKINSIIDDYVQQKVDSIFSTVKGMYVTPLINKLTPIMNEVQNETDDVHGLVNEAIEQAFSTVKQNIDTQEDSTLKTIELTVYNEIVDRYKGTLTDEINDYFDKLRSRETTDSIRDVIETQLNTWDRMINSKITGYTDSMAAELKAQVMEQSGKAVSELKEVLGDKMSGLSDQICGTITNSLEGLTTNVSDAVDTSSSSGGVTLNYKEYCKIFVFLKIAINEESMLQRCGALVEANVRASDDNHSGFRITNAFTLMYVEADVRMHTLFPWGVDVTQNEVTGDNTFGFSLGNMTENEVKLHYSGVNGY